MRTVLITGCSSGLGRALAEAFADHGDHVIATARRPEAIADLADRYETATLDVDDAGSVEACLAAIEARHGRLDVLVHNAGFAAMGPTAELPAERLRAQLETNVIAPVALTRRALPLLRQSGCPQLVFIGSVSGILATPFAGAYCASKAALHKLVDALRMELAPFGVQVVDVQPGGVASRFGDNATAGLDAWLGERSAYWALREQIYQRARVQQQGATPAAAVAAAVVAELDRTRPRPVVRLAHGSRLLPLIERWLPRRLTDRLLRRRFGLSARLDRG